MEAARAAVLASVQPTVDEIVEKFNNGTPFVDLIAEYNTDSGMEDPETLANGYPVHMDSILYDPAFVAAAFSIGSIGQISEPVVGTYGVHILYYLRDVPAGAAELTPELEAAIREQLLGEIEDEMFSTALQERLDAADITYTELGETWRYQTDTADEAVEETVEEVEETEEAGAGE